MTSLDVGSPCDCAACRLAGVAELPSHRDPQTGYWLHGEALWHFYAERGAAVGDGSGYPRGRHPDGFEFVVPK